jgi:hypothetical protein
VTEAAFDADAATVASDARVRTATDASWIVALALVPLLLWEAGALVLQASRTWRLSRSARVTTTPGGAS